MLGQPTHKPCGKNASHLSFANLLQVKNKVCANTIYTTLSEIKVLSRTLKDSSAQRSAGTFKGSR